MFVFVQVKFTFSFKFSKRRLAGSRHRTFSKMDQRNDIEAGKFADTEFPVKKEQVIVKVEVKEEDSGEHQSSAKDVLNAYRPEVVSYEYEPLNKKIKCEVLEVVSSNSDNLNESLPSSCGLIKEGTGSEVKSEESAPGNEKVLDNNEKVEKHVPSEKKKKVALLISYCGKGYSGMQRNPGVDTIEDQLIDALHKAGAIKTEVKDDLGRMSFQRCARTDKGVSAASQVVSLKMIPDKELLPEVNKHLPPSIRVFGMNRVTKGFDSKLQCSARTYQYLLPTFAFAPTEALSIPPYRIKDAEISRINQTLQIFCGTHNFHNFTSGKSPNDASSKRYIIEFKAGDTFVKKGYEFMTLSVKGQSFMLHQIRKMIGLCIAICRGFCGVDVIEKAWGKEKVDIPKAPGLGLILDKVHYDRYNEKFGSDGIHEPITWQENEKDVTDFKNNFIWDTIIESEITQRCMLRWLNTLNNHTYTENRNQLLESQNKPNHND